MFELIILISCCRMPPTLTSTPTRHPSWAAAWRRRLLITTPTVIVRYKDRIIPNHQSNILFLLTELSHWERLRRTRRRRPIKMACVELYESVHTAPRPFHWCHWLLYFSSVSVSVLVSVSLKAPLLIGVLTLADTEWNIDGYRTHFESLLVSVFM